MLKRLSARLGRLAKRLAYLKDASRIVAHSAPTWALAWLGSAILLGLLPAVNVYLTRFVVDELVAVMDAGFSWPGIQPVAVLVAVMAMVQVTVVALTSLTSWINTGLSENVTDHITRRIHQHALNLDVGFFEVNAFYDKLMLARQDAVSQPLNLVTNVGKLAQDTILLLSLVGIMATFGWWIPLLILVATLPALYITFRYTRVQNAWRLRTTLQKRQLNYLENQITTRPPAAEVRLFGIGEYFEDQYQQLRKTLREENLDIQRRSSIAAAGARLLPLLGVGVALAWMLAQVVQGRATLGMLALFYQALNRGHSSLSGLFGTLGQIDRNLLFLENYYEFMAMEPLVTDVDAGAEAGESVASPLAQGIEVQRVSFAYPGCEQRVLEDFSLLLPADKLTAIVGANGAGKSTLINLLARCFDPQAGRITIDGVDIRQIPLAELRRKMTILFQFPNRYADSAANNIALSDIYREPTPAQIESTARAAGAHVTIEKLPEGYETRLVKWLNGHDLSGGEWQRIALARAFLRQSDIVILDEPTSHMDPWAEQEWLDRLRELLAGKVALMITHRFTTAMKADIIHVMDEGEIVESGSHQQLLAANGLYAASWRKQYAPVTPD